ncbi:hypothetical protein P7C73_g1290, partial [Tremellales sp. Uapishka_1]
MLGRLSRRTLTTQAYTLLSPTPASLQQHLALHPPHPSSTTLYLLSTSLPPASLPRILTTLQATPRSVGSFSSTPPNAPPSISLLTLIPDNEEIKVIYTAKSGRRPNEVGRYQRVNQPASSVEELKGTNAGDMERAKREGEGWSGLWKEDDAGLVDELKGVDAQGNLLLKVKADSNNPNPTQNLMISIRSRQTPQDKDEEFYLGFLGGENRLEKVVKILSGDPARGAISLEMEEPLLIGQTIQFMHRAEQLGHSRPKKNVVTFCTLPKTNDVDQDLMGSPATLEGFIGFTEGGFIHSSSGESRVSTVSGSLVSLEI